MAYLCSAVIMPNQSCDLQASIADLRTVNDKVVEFSDCCSLGGIVCHFMAGRPHEVGDKELWKSIAIGEFSEIKPASSIFAYALNKAEEYSDTTGYGYYFGTRIPRNILIELCDLSIGSGMPIWVYFSEASGGSLDCEYSWLITPKEAKLIVWEEESGKYLLFSGDISEVSDMDAFSAGIDLLNVQNSKSLKEELFDN